MKQKQTGFTNQTNFRKIFIVFLISFSMYFISCNSTKDKNKETTTDTVVTGTDTSSGAGIAPGGGAVTVLSSPDKFYYLKLEAASLWQLFKQPQTEKILLQFLDSTHTAMGLVAYGAKKKNDATTGRYSLLAQSTTPFTNTGVKLLGNLEVTEKQIVAILGQSGRLTEAKCRDLYFYPVIHVSYPKYILYYISMDDKYTKYKEQGFLAPPEAKPSPPAPPCDADCVN